MRRYFVFKRYEATAKNKNFYNTEDSYGGYFYGKGFEDFAPINTSGKAKTPSEVIKADVLNIHPYFIREHGFKTKSAASKALKSHKELAEREMAYGFWKI